MRAYLLAVSGLATAIVLYAPLAGSEPAEPSPQRYGIAAFWDGDMFDTPGVISCHGRTLSVLVEPTQIQVADSISNDVVAFSGHDWKRLGELLGKHRTETQDAVTRIEVATRGTADTPVTYQALVTAMVTSEAAGYGDRTVIVDARELMTPL